MNKTIIKIESIAAGGEGIGRFEGKAVFVRQTAPGDLVRCRISEDHKTWARAELEEIVEASPDRIQPACPYYGVCGGCDFQHLPYQVQITTKTAILRDAFTRIGKITPPELKIFTSPPWEYRNRMKFHFLDGRIKIGLKANKSNEIIPITACPIADPGIQAFLKNTNQPETTGAQFPNSSHPNINAKAQNNIPQPFTVYCRNNVFLIEGGTEKGKISLSGKELHIDASVFFQSNSTMLEMMISELQKIAKEADHSRPMADLYCGVGTFSAFLGAEFAGLDLMEYNEKALKLARLNVNPPHSPPHYHCLTDTEWSAMQSGNSPHGGNSPRGDYGFIVADPPRTGFSLALAAWLAEKGPPELAYVSCNPATLARDSRILCRGGYTLTGLSMYDFYPQTSHIESLAVFHR